MSQLRTRVVVSNGEAGAAGESSPSLSLLVWLLVCNGFMWSSGCSLSRMLLHIWCQALMELAYRWLWFVKSDQTQLLYSGLCI